MHTLTNVAIRSTPVRDAIEAHLAEGHRRLGGQVDSLGPLRLFYNLNYDWTYFNTARLAHPSGDDELTLLIGRVVDFYRSRGLRPAWDVSQAWAPTTFEPRLAAHGFTLDRYESLLMLEMSYRHHHVQPGAGPRPGSDTVLRQLTLDQLDQFVVAWRAGFAIGSDTNIAQVRSLFSRDLQHGWQFWGAWREGRIVATLADLTIHGVTQISNVSTVPGARRRGLGHWLVQHSLDRALARGDWLVYLHTATGSAAERLYRRLGFTPLDTWLTYVYDVGGRW